MQAMLDSSDCLNDVVVLQERAERDGYLLLKGLLPRTSVEAVGVDLAAVMASADWIEADIHLDQARANDEKFCVEPQPAFMDVFYRQLSLRSLNALKMHDSLLAFFAQLFGEQPFPVPHSVMRVAFPHRAAYATPAHQDFVHLEGSRKNWAAWIPITTIDEARGGLAVAAGSHRIPCESPSITATNHYQNQSVKNY